MSSSSSPGDWLWPALQFSSPLPAVALAAVALAAVTLILMLYQTERRVISRGSGLVLLGLRLATLVAVLLMLAGPVAVWRQTIERRPRVAVLVDSSASMNVTMKSLSAGERLAIAVATDRLPSTARPIDLPGAALRADYAIQALARGATGNMSAAGDAGSRLERLQLQLVRTSEFPDMPLELANLASMLASQLAGEIGTALRGMTTEAGSAAVLDQWAPLRQDVLALAGEVDNFLATRLPPDQQAVLDDIALTHRVELAERLAGTEPGGIAHDLPPRVAQAVQVYPFSVAARSTSASATQPAATQPASAATDIAAAIRHAVSEAGGDPLGAIVLLSDGRQTAPGDVTAAIRAAVDLGAEVHTVLTGGRATPVDAAIVDVAAPGRAVVGGNSEITATVRTTGMAGRDVRLTLYADGEPISAQSLRPEALRQTQQARFTQPVAKPGLVRYEVKIVPHDDEITQANNIGRASVNGMDEKTAVLLVDGGPRWEYRYLRNLLQRDGSVSLQSLLVRPFEVLGLPQQQLIAARPRTADVEVDRWPVSERELLDYDLIILGDVPPEGLSSVQQEQLDAFVAERGGTIIVQAGPGYMPRAFATTPLSLLMPIEPLADETTGPAAVRLTPEGLASAMLRLGETDPTVGWSALGQLAWVSPFRTARPTATVLARAELNAPLVPLSTRPADARARDALIAWHRVGLGRVLYIGIDSTWRLRLRRGDALHGQLWQQILRWATDQHLAGWSTARFGTDASTYAVGENVVLRLRLTSPAGQSVLTAEGLQFVASQDGQEVQSATPVATGSPGLFEATFAHLPPGEVNIRLSGPGLVPLQTDDPADTLAKLQTQITIEDSRSVELVDLSTDPAAMSSWAAIGRGVMLTAGDSHVLSERLNFDPLITETETVRTLWDTWPSLLIAIGLISVEWALRKRLGLP